LGIGDWGLGPIPNPQSPIPNPQNFHTMLSGLTSLATFISFFVISIIFGKEIFTKSNPIVNSTKTRLPANETIIKLNNLPLIFYFESNSGVHIKNIKDYFQIDLYETFITPNHTISHPYGYFDVSKNCSSDDIHPNYKSLLEYEVNKRLYTCVDYNSFKVKK
jgi:hypothetical protein